MSFQSGGAILGPPGAPGAPVRIIFAVPEANLFQRPKLKCQQAGVPKLYEPRMINQSSSPPVLSPRLRPSLKAVACIECRWLVKAKSRGESQAGVPRAPHGVQHHWHAKRAAWCRANCDPVSLSVPTAPALIAPVVCNLV